METAGLTVGMTAPFNRPFVRGNLRLPKPRRKEHARMIQISATAEYEPGGWIVRVIDEDNADMTVVAHCKRLRHAEAAITAAAAAAHDVAPDDIDLTDIEVQLPTKAADALDLSTKLRAEADRANHDAAVQLRIAVRSLADDDGMASVDIASALGITSARVSALLREDPQPPTTTTDSRD